MKTESRFENQSRAFNAIKHGLQSGNNKILCGSQPRGTCIRKESLVLVKQLRVLCLAALIPCGVERCLASTLQKSAEPRCKPANFLNVPTPPSILRLCNVATFENGVLEQGNQVSAFTPDVSTLLSAQTKPIPDQTCDIAGDEPTQRSQNAAAVGLEYMGNFLCEHLWMFPLGWTISLFSGWLIGYARRN
jgi:hypothetical protein